MREAIYSETEMASFLLPEMPNRLLAVNPKGSNDSHQKKYDR